MGRYAAISLPVTASVIAAKMETTNVPPEVARNVKQHRSYLLIIVEPFSHTDSAGRKRSYNYDLANKTSRSGLCYLSSIACEWRRR